MRITFLEDGLKVSLGPTLIRNLNTQNGLPFIIIQVPIEAGLSFKHVFIQRVYKCSFIGSSLTADGVNIPRSVNNNVMYAGGV